MRSRYNAGRAACQEGGHGRGGRCRSRGVAALARAGVAVDLPAAAPSADRPRARGADPLHLSAPPAAGAGAGANPAVDPHLRPRRVVAGADHAARRDRHPQHAGLPAGAGRGLRLGGGDRGPGALRRAGPRRPLVERQPAGGGAAASRRAGVPDRRLPWGAPVQLGDRLRAAGGGARQQLHRLPAALGPARVLGGDHLDRDAGLRAADRRDAAAGGARRAGDRHPDPGQLLHHPHHDRAGRADRAHGLPLLARPPGRRRGRAADGAGRGRG